MAEENLNNTQKLAEPVKTSPAHRQKITFNLKFTLGLIVATLLFGAGVHFLHEFQVDRNADSLLAKSRQMQEEGDLGAAVNFLRNYLAFRPHDATALAEYAQLLDQRAQSPGELERAYFAYEQALRQDPDRVELRRRMVTISMLFGRYSDALNHLKLVEKNLGKSADLELLAARCYLGEERMNEAVSKLLTSIELDASVIEPYSILAGLFQLRSEELPKRNDLPQTGVPQDFLKLFTSETDADGDIEPAQKMELVLQQMVQLGEPKSEAFLRRARFYLGLGQYAKAAADLAESRKLQPDQNDLFKFSADLFLRQSLDARQANQVEQEQTFLENAIDAAKDGLQLPDADPVLYYTLFRAEQLKGNLKAAQEYVEQGIAAAESAANTASLENRGAYTDLKSDFVFAFADLLISQAANLSRNDAKEKIKQADEIIQQVRKSYLNTPITQLVDGRLQYLEGLIHFSRDEWSLAVPKFERSRNQLLENVDLRRRIDLTLGVCFQKLNNPDRRIAVFRRALREDPFWIVARIEAARALADGNLVGDAIQEYRLLGNVPGAPLELARLLLFRELRKPETLRNWEPIEQALQLERDLRKDQGLPPLPSVAVLSAELLWQQGRTDEARDILQQARVDHPDDPAIVVSQIGLVLSDTQLEPAVKLSRAEQLLAVAEEQLGDQIEFRLMRARFVGELPAEEAKRRLAELALRVDEFRVEEQAELFRRLASVHVSLGDVEAARNLLQKIIELEVDPVAARLALLELARQHDDQATVDAQLAELRKIEGPNGPYGNLLQAQQLIQGVGTKESEQLSAANRDALVQARELLQIAQRQRTSWSLIPRMLGNVEQLLGDADVAIEHYRRAIELGDMTREVVGYVADWLYKKKRYEDADQILREVNEQNPQVISGDLARLAWQVAWQQKQYDEALGLAGAVAEDSKDFRDLIWLSRLRFAEGRRGTEAEEPLQRATIQFPKEPQVWLAYVAYLERVGRDEDAVVELKKAAEILPQDPAPLAPLTLARGYEMLGMKNEAAANYQRAYQADPENVAVQVQLADYYTRNNDTDSAEQFLERLLNPQAEVPEEVRQWARRRRAQVVALRGTYSEVDEALKLFNSAGNESAPLSVEDLRTKAQILARRSTQADRRELTAVLEELRSRSEINFVEQLQLARLYQNLGRWEDARASFQALLMENPGAQAVMVEFANALIEHQDLVAARDWLDKLQPLAPSAFATMQLNVRLLHAEGRTADAISSAHHFLDDEQRRADFTQILRDLMATSAGLTFLDRYTLTLKGADPELFLKIQEGMRLLQEGQFDDAMSELSALLRQSEFQTQLQAFYHRVTSQLFSQLGNEAEAEVLIRAALEIHSRPEDQIQLASILARQQRIGDALTYCEQHLWGTLPESQAAQVSVAVLRTGEPTTADLKRVELKIAEVMAKPGSSSALMRHLADLKDLAGEYQQAVLLYAELLENNPKDLIALNNSAYLNALLGNNPQQALKSINTAIDIAGPIGALLDTRGVVHLKRKEYAKAIEDLQRAQGESPNVATQFRLALAHWHLGDQETAQQVIEEAIKSGLNRRSVHSLERAIYDDFLAKIKENRPAAAGKT